MLPLFLKAFLWDLDVGAICPTTKRSVKRVLRSIDFRKKITIVEYGPGTGAFTSELLKRLTPDSKLVLIEKNDEFFAVLKKRFGSDSRVFFSHGSAENVESYLKNAGESRADYIISGIPFSRIPKPQVTNILSATKRSLKEEACFLVYQYLPSIKRLLSSAFSQTTMKLFLYNIPPLFFVVAKR